MAGGIIVVSGAPGTGKSTVAVALADVLGVRPRRLRRRRGRVPTGEIVPGSGGGGMVARDRRVRAIEELAGDVEPFGLGGPVFEVDTSKPVDRVGRRALEH